MANRLYFISTGSDATSTARAYDFDGVRQPDDDITIGAGFWQGGLASDTRIYFISNGTNTAVAYDFDGNRQSGDDISLVSNSWQGAVASDDRLYIVSDSTDGAFAYDFDGVRQSGDDITLGVGSWIATARSDDKLFFVNNTLNTALAYDLDGNRLPASNDISLPTGTWRGGLRSDTRIYFVSGSQAIAYDYSGTRQSDDDIELGTGRWHGGAATFEDETEPNNAPVFADASYTFADVAIAVGEIVGTVAATDADSDTLSYTLTGTDNSNFAIDANGQITVATELTNSQVYSFNVVADDGTDTTSVGVSATAIADTTPALSFGSETIDNQAWVVGTDATVTLPEATGGTGTIVYTLTPALPSGKTFTAGTRVLDGNPTARFTSATFTYTATAGTESVTLTFTIVVTAPAITFASNIANQAWVVGTLVSVTLPTASGGVGTFTYSLTGTLPTGATFTAGTRVLAATPTGRFTSVTFTYTATDSEGITQTQTFTIVVTAVAITIPSITNKTWTVGTAVSFTLPEASGGVGAFTYSLSPTLPAGVSRTVRAVTGNPTTAIVIATYTYTAEDSEGITQTRTFTIVVNAAAVPIVFGDTVDAQIWDVDVAITTLTLPTATGGDGAFTYALTPTLPMGIARLNFDVDGTPTEVFAQAFFSWVATDGNGDTKTLQFTVRVRGVVTERNTNPYTYPNDEIVSLLPSNSTAFERSIEGIARYNVLPIVDGHRENPVINAWNDEKVPFAHIPCMGINLGLEVDTALTELQQRTILKCAWNLHQYAGTPHVILEIIRALGYPGVSIDEGNAAHWANYSIILNQSITIIDGRAMLKLIRDLSPSRSVLVGIDITAGAENWDGTLDFDGAQTFGFIQTSGLV